MRAADECAWHWPDYLERHGDRNSDRRCVLQRPRLRGVVRIALATGDITADVPGSPTPPRAASRPNARRSRDLSSPPPSPGALPRGNNCWDEKLARSRIETRFEDCVDCRHRFARSMTKHATSPKLRGVDAPARAFYTTKIIADIW